MEKNFCDIAPPVNSIMFASVKRLTIYLNWLIKLLKSFEKFWIKFWNYQFWNCKFWLYFTAVDTHYSEHVAQSFVDQPNRANQMIWAIDDFLYRQIHFFDTLLTIEKFLIHNKLFILLYRKLFKIFFLAKFEIVCF